MASTRTSLPLRRKPVQQNHALRVNKTKSTGEKVFKDDHFGTEENHVSSNEEKILFWVFLKICDLHFNT